MRATRPEAQSTLAMRGKRCVPLLTIGLACSLLAACSSGAAAGPKVREGLGAGRALELVEPLKNDSGQPAGVPVGWGVNGGPFGNQWTVTADGTVVCGSFNVQPEVFDWTAGTFRPYDAAQQAKIQWPVALKNGGLIAVRTGRWQLFGQDHPGAAWTVVAGTQSTRDANNQGSSPDDPEVPRSGPALQTALSSFFAPIGQRADGSVVIADGQVVWGLKDGTLTELYRSPNGTFVADTTQQGAIGAVDSQGTIAVATVDRGDSDFRLRSVLTIGPDGTTARLPVPATINGVVGVPTPGDLRVASIIADPSGGFLIRAGEPQTQDPVKQATHQYVLRVQDGRWQVVAASHEAPGDIESTKMSRTASVDAQHIPLFLPSSMAVTGRRLLLGDECGDYAIEVGLPGA